MQKKKLATLILVAMSMNMSVTPINALAVTGNNLETYEIQESLGEEGKEVSTEATIKKFELYGKEELARYNDSYKVQRSDIASFTNNGGKYGSSTLDKAFDNNLLTHFETGKSNSTGFTNEIIVTFEEEKTLDRIVYAARQDGAKGKGFAQSVEIYASLTEGEDDFSLVCSGRYTGSTADLVEIKFAASEFKRVKFVFREANQGWASASELWFYEEDKLIDEMTRLFTDSTMSAVSSEFNTIDKINELEERAKTHPLYNIYKEDIENAKRLVEGVNSEFSNAKVSKFLSPTSELLSSYNDVYKVARDKIASITTNGSQYGNNSIDKALDGDFNTSWHSGKTNSDSFNNEVVITLKENTEINRVVYTSARGTNRGYAQEFDIYVSNTTKGDTFELISSGSSTVSQDSIEIKFNPVQARRVKFVYKKSYENWALASEFGLYTQDTVSEKVDRLFKTGFMDELSDEFNSLDKILELEEEVNNHPLKTQLIESINIAKALFNEDASEKDYAIVTASQRGEIGKESREHQIVRGTISLDTSGRYITPGETIKVYVDADENGIMPELFLGQIAKDKNDWRRSYKLKKGLNVITAPSFDNMNPAVIYVSNPATPAEQAYAPKVKIEGGTAFPVYYHGITDPADYEKELEEYTKKISTDDNDFANGVRSDVFYNVTELISENNTISTTAAGALKGIQEIKPKNMTVADTMDNWEVMWEEFNKFNGFVKGDENPVNDYYMAKYTSRVFCQGPYGWSEWGNTGYNGGNDLRRDGGVFKEIVKPFALTDDWLYYHEWGHSVNNSQTEHVDVTNNLFSAHMRRVLNIKGGVSGDCIDWNTLYSRFSGNSFNLGFFTNLGIISQPLYYYGTDTYGKASRIARENKDGVLNGLSNNQQRLVVAYSLAVGYDLTDFFNDWNYCAATETMKNKVKHLPKPDVKLEYMHSLGVDYKGTGFTEDTEVFIESIVTNSTNNTNNLVLGVDENSKDAVMGYEIYRNGEVVGYTASSTFVDKNITPGESYEYEVVAYDKKLKESKKAGSNMNTPNVKVDEGITVNLNEEFDIKKYVTAKDNLGKDLRQSIEIISSNVDTSKRGNYTVEFSVENNGVKVNKTANVNVVSNSIYVSDMEWKSSSAGYGSIKKDKDHNNQTILLSDTLGTREYNKGIGMHAISEVVLDIEGKNFETFETYVGADAHSTYANTSVNFEVYVDGEKKYDSGRMTITTGKKFVSLDVKDAKEVKLVMSDSGNGISCDSGVWGDTKFTLNSTKPEIKVPETTYIKLNDSLNLLDGVTAKDIEDGDLTSSIKVNDGGFNPNKTGEYTVTYTAADSEDNTTTVERKVVVYSGLQYLSDVNWESARTDYSTVKKNLASGGAKIKLNVDGEEKVFDKGIGTHANSEIVYNLEGTNYEYFETYVGVDRNIAQNNNSSIIFEFYLDGETVYTTVFMNYNDTAKLVRIPLNNASKLKLVVTNAGNGNTSDHADFGDAKFFITNSKPQINVESKKIATKMGVPVDLTPVFTAVDAEDGDLTSKVVVENNVNFNKSGNYTQTFTVTDSDGNTTVETREIAVVSMNDYTYLSDINWKSAQNGNAPVRKDLATGGTAMKLLGENGETVNYTKGIGTHSYSTIVYDLTNADYEYFTSFIGIDRAMVNRESSVEFKIYLDGVLAFNSGLVQANDVQRFIELNITGAKELKLEVTDYDGTRGADWANFADAKLHVAVEGSEIEVVVNKDGLTEIVNNSSFNELHYSREDAESHKAILDEAKLLLEDENATQEDIDAMIIKIAESEGTIKIRENKVELQKRIEEAKLVEDAGYHEIDWYNFKCAIGYAEEIYNNIDATDLQVRSGLFTLQFLFEQLV